MGGGFERFRQEEMNRNEQQMMPLLPRSRQSLPANFAESDEEDDSSDYDENGKKKKKKGGKKGVGMTSNGKKRGRPPKQREGDEIGEKKKRKYKKRKDKDEAAEGDEGGKKKKKEKSVKKMKKEKLKGNDLDGKMDTSKCSNGSEKVDAKIINNSINLIHFRNQSLICLEKHV